MESSCCFCCCCCGRRTSKQARENVQAGQAREEGATDGGKDVVCNVVCFAKLVAFRVRHGVGEGERDGDDDEDEGEQLELEEGKNGEEGPNCRDNVHERPKDLGVDRIDVSVWVGVLKDPDGLAELVRLVPPA